MKPRAPTPGYRLDVAARIAAALVGGYAVAVLASILLGVAHPLAREEAGTIGALAGLLVLPVAAMGCFWARSSARAWAGILIAAALLGGLAWIAGWRP